MKALTAWNLDAFVEAVNEKSPNLDWSAVFEHLDTPQLAVNTPTGLALITTLHRRTCRAPLPVTVLLGEWKHASAQMRLITRATNMRAP